jgi:fatty-acyl-CoA synthase
MATRHASGFDPVAFHAAFRPEKTACVDLTTGEKLGYGAFSARASAAAQRIVKLAGKKRGERIAVISRNSIDMAVIAIACQRAGAVFTPLNWRLTASELSALIADAEPGLVIASSEFEAASREAMAMAGAKAAFASPEEVAKAAPPARETALKQTNPGDACTILYTSGTTGKPKGVVITNDNAVWSSQNFAAVAEVNASSVLLCDAPMFHTVGLIAIVRTALQMGATVLISDRFIPSVTLQRLSDPALGVTHYFVVPQMVEALLKEPGFATADLSRLTALFSGGGPLSPALVKGCVDRGVLLVNGYGMSEVGSAVHMPLDASYMQRNSHAVGFAAPWLEVRLAGLDGEPVAHGEIGEIWMRGPSVSPGYWRQIEATAASRTNGWFRTGDLARRQDDGALAIVDRLKDMYISGGENVYPAEVELVLRQVEGVIDAAVVGVEDARWGEVGCAFIEASKPEAQVARAIRETCATRLARFKQPTHIRVVEALPRTGSGKVIKAKLRELFHADAAQPRSA